MTSGEKTNGVEGILRIAEDPFFCTSWRGGFIMVGDTKTVDRRTDR